MRGGEKEEKEDKNKFRNRFPLNLQKGWIDV